MLLVLPPLGKAVGLALLASRHAPHFEPKHRQDCGTFNPASAPKSMRFSVGEDSTIFAGMPGLSGLMSFGPPKSTMTTRASGHQSCMCWRSVRSGIG